MHVDTTQAFAPARAGGALAIGQVETRAMRRAHQLPFLAAQELARRPVEPAPRMRTDVQERTDTTGGIAIEQQRFGVALQHRFDLVQAVRRQRLQSRQDVSGIVACIAIFFAVI